MRILKRRQSESTTSEDAPNQKAYGLTRQDPSDRSSKRNTSISKTSNTASVTMCGIPKPSPVREKNTDADEGNEENTVATEWLDESGRSQSNFFKSSCSSVLSNSNTVQSLDRPFRNKQVSFGEIEVHIHMITLGDNPSVHCGPPISIAWKSCESYKLDVDAYESEKPKPRTKQAILLPRSIREEILRGQGFSRGELKEASEEVARVQQQRQQSSREGRLIRQCQNWTKRLKRSKRSCHTRLCTGVFNE